MARLDIKFSPHNKPAKLLCLFLAYPKHWFSIKELQSIFPGKTAYCNYMEKLQAAGIEFEIKSKKKKSTKGCRKFRISSDKNLALATYFRINNKRKK